MGTQWLRKQQDRQTMTGITFTTHTTPGSLSIENVPFGTQDMWWRNTRFSPLKHVYLCSSGQQKRFLMFLGALTVQGLPIVIPFLPVLRSRLIHALDAAVAHESGDEPKSHQHRERTATLAWASTIKHGWLAAESPINEGFVQKISCK